MTREETLNRFKKWCQEQLGNHCSDKDAQMANNIMALLEQEPCEDCVSRQAVIDAIDVKAWEFCDYLISKNRNDEQKPVSHFADNLRECIREELPSVNPQPKTGHWIYEDVLYSRCSECGELAIIANWSKVLSDFCPNCGTKMIEPQEEREKA